MTISDDTLRWERTLGDKTDLAALLKIIGLDESESVAPSLALVKLTVSDPAGDAISVTGVSSGVEDGVFTFAWNAELQTLAAGDYRVFIDVASSGSGQDLDTWSDGFLQIAQKS